MKKITLLIMVFGAMGFAQFNEVKSGVYKWDSLPIKQGDQRVGRKIMEGSSPYFSFLEIHATTQEKGALPGKPHTQENIEEIVIVKEGLMKMTMNGISQKLPAGSVVLIPPLVEQSMQNIGDGPLSYYIIMYTAKKDMDIKRGLEAGGFQFFNFDELTNKPTAKGGRIDYFNRATSMCEQFEMHVTQLNKKGPSHKAHSHSRSEIIIVMEGKTQVTIDGEMHKGVAGDLFMIKSNAVHGISNIGDSACRYFVLGWK